MEGFVREEEEYPCYCGSVYDSPELAALCHVFHQLPSPRGADEF